jgi:hypothetical protein
MFYCTYGRSFNGGTEVYRFVIWVVLTLTAFVCISLRLTVVGEFSMMLACLMTTVSAMLIGPVVLRFKKEM